MPPLPEPPSKRLLAVDALRGLVMLLMIIDHVRRAFLQHYPVDDPMDVARTDPSLFLMRSLSHLCAPVFVFLAGVSAMLYHQKVEDRRQVSIFLLKRGLILVLMEMTVVNLAWVFDGFPMILLVVIWVLGLSMMTLAGLLWLPKLLILMLALVIVAGHNLLDGIELKPDSLVGVIWIVLLQGGFVHLGGVRVLIGYPLLPWIGVISLGYLAGALYNADVKPKRRLVWISLLSLAALALFFLLRGINVYGDKPWVQGETLTRTLMSFFNLSKYPPSLLFILWTLGIGLALLAWLETLEQNGCVAMLAQFGGAPMFMYLLHLYILKVMYFFAEAIWGKNQGEYFGFPHVWMLPLCTIMLAAFLFWPVCTFAKFKARRRDISWLKYF